MRPMKAIIAEDEPVLRAELKETLARLWPDLEICAEAEDGIEALRALSVHAPDILFLDIQLPGLSGLEVAKQASGRCHVAFVTAYDKYAVAAFEQGAVDYVMKPFSAARLATTVARLKEKIASAPANLDGILKSLAAKLERRRSTCAGSPRRRARTCGSSPSRRSATSRPTVSTRWSRPRIRVADQEADQGVDRRTRSFRLLADSSLDRRQRERHRRCQPRPAWPPACPAEAAQGDAGGERFVLPPVQADVTSRRGRQGA